MSQADAALESLEGEGIVLRGRFTPPGRVVVCPTGSASRQNGVIDVCCRAFIG